MSNKYFKTNKNDEKIKVKLVSDNQIRDIVESSIPIEGGLVEILSKLRSEAMDRYLNLEHFEIVFNEDNCLWLKDSFTGCTAIMGFKINFKKLEPNLTFIIREKPLEFGELGTVKVDTSIFDKPIEPYSKSDKLTLDWIIATLKKSGINSKQVVIERLENANKNELRNLSNDIQYVMSHIEEKENGN